MYKATLIGLWILFVGSLAVNYDAADGGWLFNRKQERRCTPGIEKPAEVPFPIDELDEPDVKTVPDTICPLPVCPPVLPDNDPCGDLAERVAALETNLAAVDIDVIVQTVIAQLPEPQPAESPDISIIVGEVLKRLPPQVAYYEIVPRTPR